MMRVTGMLLGLLGVAVCSAPAMAQDEMITRINRARGLIVATATEDAIDSLRAIRTDLATTTDGTREAEVLTYLAKAQLSLGDVDAATANFQALFRLDPFYSLDSTAHNPDVINLYRGARASMAVVAVTVPADTTVKPDTETLNVGVGVGKAGSVTFRFVPLSGVGPVHSVQVGVTSNTTVTLSLLPTDSTALPPGEYRLDVLFRGPDGTSDSNAVLLGVERLPVDTTVHLPAVDPSLFRTETRKGSYVLTSVIQGVLVGAAAGAIPALVANKEVNDPKIPLESIGLGVGIGVAGLLGAVIGRSDVTVQENVDFNIELINSRIRENALVAAANARLRELAPLRVVVRSP